MSVGSTENTAWGSLGIWGIRVYVVSCCSCWAYEACCGMSGVLDEVRPQVYRGGFEYLHRSPASRKRGNPVPGGYKYGTWPLRWGILESETVKCGHESCWTQTWECIHWRGPAAIVNDISIRTMTVSVQLKKNMAVTLKGLGAKTNWLAVNRQS
jgi:hypothetical protein